MLKNESHSHSWLCTDIASCTKQEHGQECLCYQRRGFPAFFSSLLKSPTRFAGYAAQLNPCPPGKHVLTLFMKQFLTGN